MKQELVSSLLSKEDLNNMKRLTVKNIAIKLLGIFENHISGEKAISRTNLFHKIFSHYDNSGLADELRWMYAKKAMHFLRQKTKCFVASEYREDDWYYFVVKTKIDAQCYVNNLEKNIKRMKTMQKKAIKAYQQGWHKLDWKTDAFKNNILN